MNTYIIRGVFLGVVLLAGVVTFPPTTGAETPSPSALEKQVAELLKNINELKGQLGALEIQGGQSSVVPTNRVVSTDPSGLSPVLGTSRVCRSSFSRSLSPGSEGDDVRSLQEYLCTEGYFSEEATGYFGPLTKDAVTKWQTSQGITGVGIVGPRTRARMKERCGWVLPTLPSQKVLQVTPSSGVAPLTVTASTWVSGFHAPGTSYQLDFGDGTSITPTYCSVPADACVSPGTDTHTYTKDGTYTAVLTRVTDPCGGNRMCMAPTQLETLGSVTVTVGSVACTREYNPVCGSKPIVCITTPCDPIPQTYGNACSMKADGATLLYKGECRPTTMNQSPVISSFGGPTTLDVREKGTWKITASDPEKGQLTYTVLWGDEVMTGDSVELSVPMMMPVRQTTTFTHSYAKAGNYTITVIVLDREGNSAETTTTVEVGRSTVCNDIYEPVCGLPSGCANVCPPGLYCTMMCQMPEPVTYSNTCSLEAAGATKLYEGRCEPGSGISPLIQN